MAATSSSSKIYTQDIDITIKLSDISILKKIKDTLLLFKGVESVTTHSNMNKDITKTASFHEAMDDKKNNRIYHAKSVDDMFDQILG